MDWPARARVGVACILPWLASCASAPAPSATPVSASGVEAMPSKATPSKGEATPSKGTEGSPARAQTEELEPSSLTREQLVGEWAEYWALEGSAQTQHYLFAADGSYVWRPPPSQAGEVSSRAGRWRLQEGTLVLMDASGAEVERLTLGACPPNREAEQLDHGYRCLSLGNQAFWRREAPP